MYRRVGRFGMLVVCFGLCASGCSDGEGKKERGYSIGPEGGTITLKSGLYLEVPSGALEQEVELTVTELTPPDSCPATAIGASYEIGPSGTVFKSPVTIRVPYDPAKLPAGHSEAEARIFTTDATSGDWVGLVSKAADGTLTAQLSHLSPVLPGVLATSESNETPSCGGGCKADLTQARNLLLQGEILAAYQQYKCADSAEAAFGAGVTKLLLLAEGDIVSGLLKDYFDLPPLKLKEIFGEGGYLKQLVEIGQGGGNLTASLLDGDVPLIFDKMRLANGSTSTGTSSSSRYNVDAANFSSEAFPDFAMTFSRGASDPALTAGTTLAIEYDCATDGWRKPVSYNPSIDLTFYQGKQKYRCRLPTMLSSATCKPSGGKIVFTKAGTTLGAAFEIDFQSTLLSCDRTEVTRNACGESGSSDTPISSSEVLVFLKGRLADTLTTADPVTTGFHPIIDDSEAMNELKQELTVTQLVQRLGGAVPDLDLAACYFHKAFQSAPASFTFPNFVWGGSDLEIGKGDANLAAALLSALASFAHMAQAYDVPILLNWTKCGKNCPSDAQLVDNINGAVSKLVTASQFTGAQAKFARALAFALEGVKALDAKSVFTRRPATAPALDLCVDYLNAAQRSLTSGPQTLPYVSPAIPFNLKQLFASPPDPNQVSCDPLVYEQDADGAHIAVVECFFRELLDGIVTLDWENWDYSFESGKDQGFKELGEDISCFLQRNIIPL